MEELDLIKKYGNFIPGMSVVFPIEDWMNFITEDGISIHTYKYSCEQPRAIVVILHEMHGYSQTSGYLAQALSKCGVEVLAYDQRGHGKSAGLRGYISNARVLVKDASDFLAEVKKLYPGLGVYLIGLGLGGTLAINLVEEGIVQGIVLFNPRLGINSTVEGVIRKLSGCFAACIPTLGILGEDYCRNPMIRRYMQENPYFCHGRIRIGTYAAVMDMMMEARKKFYLVKVPVLVLQSEKDVANNVKRVNEFMKEVDVQDKTILMYPLSYYSIFFENTTTEICMRICEWITQKLKVRDIDQC